MSSATLAMKPEPGVTAQEALGVSGPHTSLGRTPPVVGHIRRTQV